MSDFYIWFITGLEHIADWNGYDHMLFLLALSGVYSFKNWKKLLILITAFTIGHSITLALSVLNYIVIKSEWIEFFIPLTILSTCILNLKNLDKPVKYQSVKYILTLFFGLIHGLGFSYLLKSLLGKEENISGPLFAFNIGLEAGQIIIVGLIFLISITLTSFLKIAERDKNFFISSAVFGIAFIMTSERLNILIH
ncbi:MAG: HupE/UreJ family protein [Bacteroidia bacterium]